MGGVRQDEEPLCHAAASPHCREEIVWRDHHHRVHLAVAVAATARQLDRPCECLAIPQKMKKNEKQDFYGCQHFEMSIVMQHTYFGRHRDNI